MGIDIAGEGEEAGASVAFANGATANSAQQPSKTLILRRKTPLSRRIPSLGNVAVPVDERPAINPAANKSENEPLNKLHLFLPHSAVISTRVKKKLYYIAVAVYLSLVNICCNVGYRLLFIYDVTDASISRYTRLRWYFHCEYNLWHVTNC